MPKACGRYQIRFCLDKTNELFRIVSGTQNPAVVCGSEREAARIAYLLGSGKADVWAVRDLSQMNAEYGTSRRLCSSAIHLVIPDRLEEYRRQVELLCGNRFENPDAECVLIATPEDMERRRKRFWEEMLEWIRSFRISGGKPIIDKEKRQAGRDDRMQDYLRLGGCKARLMGDCEEKCDETKLQSAAEMGVIERTILSTLMTEGNCFYPEELREILIGKNRGEMVWAGYGLLRGKGWMQYNEALIWLCNMGLIQWDREGKRICTAKLQAPKCSFD